MENHLSNCRIRADIDLNAIRENIDAIKKNLQPQVRICAVVKADGYGHGAVPVANHIQDIVSFFAVATIEEALELRNAGIDKPILILGYVFPSDLHLAVTNDIRLTVFDFKTATEISALATELKLKSVVHLKIDTGMGRIGFAANDESIRVIRDISGLPGIAVEGLFTHFFSSDSSDLGAADRQLKDFVAFCDKVGSAGIDIPIKHCSNSAAATAMPQADMDMVRLGISIYGLYPSDAVTAIKLKPALSLKSHIIMLKTITAGQSVSYGATYTADKDTVIATIPVGYADGYKRSLSNKGYVLVKGQRAPITGRICMDMFMVDVSGIAGLSTGDEVVLVGQSDDEEITMEEISGLAGSFNYEFACNVGKRVPRVYHK